MLVGPVLVHCLLVASTAVAVEVPGLVSLAGLWLVAAVEAVTGCAPQTGVWHAVVAPVVAAVEVAALALAVAAMGGLVALAGSALAAPVVQFARPVAVLVPPPLRPGAGPVALRLVPLALPSPLLLGAAAFSASAVVLVVQVVGKSAAGVVLAVALGVRLLAPSLSSDPAAPGAPLCPLVVAAPPMMCPVSLVQMRPVWCSSAAAALVAFQAISC